jgi:periplasmic copper chaperone A
MKHMLKRLGLASLCALTFVLLVAAQAAAHVTVSPSSIPQGTDDVILTFRVPNESATATVTGLKIQFPLERPIVLVNPEAGSGWQVSVIKTALPKPVTTDDGTFTSTTSEIDWTGNTIPVGQFGEFNVLAQGIPTGTSQLTFKAIQTYSDGSVVSWIQVPSKAVPNPEHPAPIVTLTAASGGSSGAATTTTAAPAAGPTTAATAAGGNDNAAAIAALILAMCAVLLSLLAVWLGRPRLGRAEARVDEADDVDAPVAR